MDKTFLEDLTNRAYQILILEGLEFKRAINSQYLGKFYA